MKYYRLISIKAKTTGFDCMSDVIELAMIIKDLTGEVEYDEYGKTDVDIETVLTTKTKEDGSPKTVTELTGVTKAMSNSGKTQKELVKDFIDAVTKLPSGEKVLITAYNAKFDLELINEKIKEYYPEYDLNQAKFDYIDYLDVMAVYMDYYPRNKEFGNASLETACRRFKTVAQNTHRAIDDVKAMLEVLDAMTGPKAPHSFYPFINNFSYYPKYGIPNIGIDKIIFNEITRQGSYALTKAYRKRTALYKKQLREQLLHPNEASDDF